MLKKCFNGFAAKNSDKNHNNTRCMSARNRDGNRISVFNVTEDNDWHSI